ncbi:radical SAM family heme chaperone HemW [Ectothiorhodospira variabilis]|uniref:radical SAM family heme chaperone HemW n=1 Tax=Ectothiorhodospira variabilis TaxID=505694 RepID=UPI001EFB2374|nr:radical SAM family heme chaperone HemW [Ectothiorhodospira variabilis]MCG5493574.1 radical SAM family heme chaperone HemW [Ectothiorhodospira variabilis]MCG5502903.1 radical SAM family heme chaperone HemW [Ectothiorhodospira variabilis]MCG5506309.1 radical SAM family heme chaperone HemW [Ectothiorhodospira variabilis]
MFASLPAPPLSLYIHLPWCVRKCPYCDFNSHAADSVPESDYVDALIADLEADLPLVWGRRLESIFLGGGTPSLFSPEAIDRLLSAIRARLTCRPGIEISMEANPGTVEQDRFRGYREAGVNRLSIGVQSFDDGLLQRLERIHTGDEAHGAVAAARAAGFDNLNLDLMFGLPGQGLDQALQDLDTALALRPEHLSWYELTLEPNTRFASHPPTLPDEDTQWDMQQAGDERLQVAGYAHYEVSAHALPGRQCIHNLNYWHFGDYLGIGAGAHGKLTLPGEGRILRRWKQRQPQAFMDEARAGSAVAGERALTVADAAFEFMLNGLRLREGVTVEMFTAHTGLTPEVLEPARGRAVERGLLANHADRLVATELGRRYLNDLVGMFLEDQP